MSTGKAADPSEGAIEHVELVALSVATVSVGASDEEVKARPLAAESGASDSVSRIEVEHVKLAEFMIHYPCRVILVCFAIFIVICLLDSIKFELNNNSEHAYEINADIRIHRMDAMNLAIDYVMDQSVTAAPVKTQNINDFMFQVMWRKRKGDNILNSEDIDYIVSVENKIYERDPEGYFASCLSHVDIFPQCSDDAMVSPFRTLSNGTGEHIEQSDIDALVAFAKTDVATMSSFQEHLIQTNESRYYRSYYRFGLPYPDINSTHSSFRDKLHKVEKQNDLFLDWAYPTFDKLQFSYAAKAKKRQGLELIVLCGSCIDRLFDKLVDEAFSWVIFSILTVWVMMSYHLKSLFLSTMAMLQIMMGFPCAYFFYRYVIWIAYFDTISLLIIFVILGIGADDVFVYTDAWEQSLIFVMNPNDLVERMSFAFRRASKAMLVTQLTTFFAFLGTTFSPILPIRAFGVWAAFVVICNYVLVITFYPATLSFWYQNLKDYERQYLCCLCVSAGMCEEVGVVSKGEGDVCRICQCQEMPTMLKASAGGKSEEKSLCGEEPAATDSQAEGGTDEAEVVETEGMDKAKEPVVSSSALKATDKDANGEETVDKAAVVEENTDDAKGDSEEVAVDKGVKEDDVGGDNDSEDETPALVRSPSMQTFEKEIAKGRTVERFLGTRFVAFINAYKFYFLAFYAAFFCMTTYFASHIEGQQDQEDYFPKNHYVSKMLNWPSKFYGGTLAAQITLTMMWGPKERVDRSKMDLWDTEYYGDVKWDKHFDLAPPNAQQHFYDTCVTAQTDEDWAEDLYDAYSDESFSCFMFPFVAWVNETYNGTLEFPYVFDANDADAQRIAFLDLLHTWVTTDATGNYYLASGDLGYLVKEKKLYYALIWFNLKEVFYGGAKKIMRLHRRFQDRIKDLNQLAEDSDADSLSRGFQTTRWAVAGVITSRGFTQSAKQGIAVALPLAFIVLIFSTSNWIVSVFAASTIVLILSTEVALMVWQGWELGAGESVSVVVMIGFSVDYVVHFGNAYIECEFSDKRMDRLRFSLFTMGISVIFGALTTFGSGLFLYFPDFMYFRKFGILIMSTVSFSLLFALTYFTSLLAAFGPEGDKGYVPVWEWVHRYITEPCKACYSKARGN